MNIHYIIVAKAQTPSVFLANGLPPYQGIDRTPWGCVDKNYYSKLLPERISSIRKKSFESYLGNLSFGSLNNLAEAKQLLSACENDVKNYEIVAIVEHGPLTSTNTLHSFAGSMGIDGYVDGFGSILRLGIFEQPQIFRGLWGHLNSNGLFDSVEPLRGYWQKYTEETKTANLEPIEAPQDVILYSVSRINTD